MSKVKIQKYIVWGVTPTYAMNDMNSIKVRFFAKIFDIIYQQTLVFSEVGKENLPIILTEKWYDSEKIVSIKRRFSYRLQVPRSLSAHTDYLDDTTKIQSTQYSSINSMFVALKQVHFDVTTT